MTRIRAALQHGLRLSVFVASISSVATQAQTFTQTFTQTTKPVQIALDRPLVDQAISCKLVTPASLNRLSLLDTMAHVMCNTPALNQALLLVDEQQAISDVAQSAFRPRFSVRAELAARGIPSSNSGAGFLNSSATGSVGLSWVLFDAGARAATLEQSRQVLSAAKASQQVAVLNAVNEALRLYVEAATAFARLDALREAESVARQSVEVAQVKYDAFVVSLAEKLQAQTALAQATLDRVRADGVWDTARGSLVLAMGFSINQPLNLATINDAFPISSSSESNTDPIDISKSQHPRLRVARADIMAVKSRLDSIRAERYGSLSLSASSGMTRDLSAEGGRFQSSVSGGLLASVPLFNGAEQQAREALVLAQIASREEAMVQVERDLISEVWRNTKLLETEAQSLQAAQLLLSAATQSYQITFGRYKAGVGSILELITTQSALSTARSQLVQAQIALAQARLRLEVSTGRIVLTQ